MTNMRRNGQSERASQQDRRITITGARRMLGMIGKNYEDEDILAILDVLYGIADEGFEAYSNQSKNSGKQSD